MDLIDIEAERRKKKKAKRQSKKLADGPELNCMTVGPDGKTYYLFSVHYAYKKKNYSFDIWAASRKEAELRVDCIKRYPTEITQTMAMRPQ